MLKAARRKKKTHKTDYVQRNKDKDASKHLGHNANHKKCGETSLKH